MGCNIRPAEAMRLIRIYRVIALWDVVCFVILFTEGLFQLFSWQAFIFFISAFVVLYIGIGAEQRAQVLKWALWRYENRHILAEYKQKYGEVVTSEGENSH